jgi:AraC-like DNA-binding protein
MDLITLIILLGMAQGIFLGSLLIIIRSPNRRANRFLGVLYFTFSISISHFFFLRTGLYSQFPFMLRVSFPVLFLFGPLYYYYVRILTDRTVSLRPVELLHTLPFIATIAMSIPFFLSSTQEKLASIEPAGDPAWVHMGLIIGSIQVAHVFAYVGVVLRILQQYDLRIRETKSSIERINLRWLRTGTIGFIVVFSLIFILILLQAAGIPTYEIYSISVPIMVSFIIYILGYLGLRQPEIFSPSEELGKKYERSSLTASRLEEYTRCLREHMDAQRPHLDDELTLPSLADQLSIPPHHLSQVINSQYNLSFFDFVNGYRVEEAKRLLLDKTKSAYTILAIAQEAGFNSKTAFNAAFKRLTGQTPSVFRVAQLP